MKKIASRAPSPIDKLVGQRIREARETADLTQSALAAALGISFQQLQKYELGRNRMSVGHLHAAAVHLGLPVGWFFDGVKL